MPIVIMTSSCTISMSMCVFWCFFVFIFYIFLTSDLVYMLEGVGRVKVCMIVILRVSESMRAFLYNDY